ncbi:MAG: hypothetical protein JST83_08600 [Bacteroidetes bacterium]|nr:hypothetical protein [Bacteroidota bacterium]
MNYPFKKTIHSLREWIVTVRDYITHNFWYRHVGVPFFFGLSIELVASAAHPVLEEMGKTGKIDLSLVLPHFKLASLTVALLGYILMSIYELKRFSKNHKAIELLTRLYAGFSTPVEGFGKNIIEAEIDHMGKIVNSLSAGGIAKVSIEEKIKLLSFIIDDLGDITSFMATSLDRPSLLQKEEFLSFFKLQEENIKCKDKKRLVVLTKQVLSDEFKNHSDSLAKYLNWHIDNGFQVHILINHDNLFETKVRGAINMISAKDDVLTDFAIINEKQVYGETIKAHGYSYVKLYAGPRDFDQNVTWAYRNFYKYIWEQQYQLWNVMTVEQVNSELFRLEKLKDTKKNAYYTALMSFDKRDDFIQKFNNYLGEQRDIKMFCVDLINLKEMDGIQRLRLKEFQDWFDINKQMVRNGCSVERVYVKIQKHHSEDAAREEYQKVIAPQKQAGIKILFASASELIKRNITTLHDFCYIENKLCCSFGWDEVFASDSFSIENNFDSIEMIELFYRNRYEKIRNYATDITSKNESEIVHYLMNLNWK